MRSSNPQYLYLEKVKITGIFADAQLASDLQCSDDVKCDILDRVFPIEDPLVSTLVGLVVKELSNAEYKPEDSDNNASDDLSNLAAFIQRNTKSAIAKSLE